jgi:CRP-like cAMP-binding protein
MAKDARALRDEAAAATAAGKHKRALDAYLELERLEPRDAQWAKRAGETYRRLGNQKHAIEAFNRSAERYAQNGFLVQAIAVCKLVLQIDPQHVDTLRRLARMNEQVGQGPTRAGAVAEHNPTLHHDPNVAAIRRGSVGYGPTALPSELAAAAPAAPRLAGTGNDAEPGRDSSPDLAVAAGGSVARALPSAAPAGSAPLPPREGGPWDAPRPLTPTPPPPTAVTRAKSKPIVVVRGAPLESVSLSREVPAAHPRDGSSPGIHVIPIDEPAGPGGAEPAGSGGAEGAGAREGGQSRWPRAPTQRGVGHGSGAEQPAAAAARAGARAARAEGLARPPTGVPVRAAPAADRARDDGDDGDRDDGDGDDDGPLETTASLVIEIEPPDATPWAVEVADTAEVELDDIEEIPLPAPRAIGLAAQQALAATPLFAGLSSALLESLVEHLALVPLERGDVLFREGEPSDALYVVVEGEVSVRAAGPPPIELARLGPGAFLGEVALLTDQPRAATALALAPAELLRIDRDTLAAVLGAHGDLLRAVLRFVRDRLVDRWMRSSALFRPFDDTERAELATKFAFLEIDPGTLLLGAGQRPDGLYIVLAGQFDVVRDGRTVVALGPGDLIGETALLSGGAFRSDVVARGKSLALCLPALAFREVIMTHPHVLEYLGEHAENSRRLQIW